MAIKYVTREPVRNADTVARLRSMAEGQQLEPVVAIERAASRIATEMGRIHGGSWRTEIDHSARYVLVRPD